MSAVTDAVDAEDWSPQWILLIYTGLTYMVSWSIWSLWAFFASGSSVGGTILFVLGGLGPFAVSAFLVRTTQQSVRSWISQVFRLRVATRYYAIALLLPVGLMLVAAVFHVAVFEGVVTPEAVPATSEYPLFLGFVLLFGGGLEEPGWRGYLLQELQREHSPFMSAVLIGIVWIGWHLPLFFIPGTIQSSLPLGLYVLQIMGLSILLTWITNAAHGSVLPAILLHAGGNTVVNYYPVGGVAGATSLVGLGLLVATITACAVVLVIVAGPSLGLPPAAQ